MSHHQGVIDWSAVAGAGVPFAHAKATEGVGFRDPTFAANWAGMQAAGLMRGAYHFFRPADSVTGQAEAFVETVGALGAGDLPPALDLEEARTATGGDAWALVSREERVPRVVQWLERIEAALGRRPLIYTRRGFIQQTLPGADVFRAYGLWIAQYTDAPAPAVPPIWPTWTLWQHSDHGRVPGVPGPVDLDTFNGSLADLTRLASPDA